jgi:chromosome segregation ATPase
MTKYYLLIPCVLIAAFALYHHGAVRRAEEVERALVAQAAEKQAALDARRAELQRSTQEQARLQTAKREAEDRERVDKKRRDYESLLAGIAAETTAQVTAGDQLAAETADLTRDLAALRAKKSRLEQEISAATRALDTRHVERRRVEMETQLTASTMLARLNEVLSANQPRF